MKLLTEDEAKIREAGSNAKEDYGRALVLYQNHVMTRQEFIRITNTISEVYVSAIEDVKLQTPEVDESGKFTLDELVAWLKEIINHNDSIFGQTCSEIIDRLDGFENFVADMRKEKDHV